MNRTEPTKQQTDELRTHRHAKEFCAFLADEIYDREIYFHLFDSQGSILEELVRIYSRFLQSKCRQTCEY